MDGADLYELELVEGGYRWDGGARAFEQSQDTLRVRQEDGTLAEVPLTVLRSVHGPVLSRKQDRAVALRLASLDRPHLMEQYWDMVRATSLEEFEAALARLQMPFFNVLYADRDGHILYLFGGCTPRRPHGDRAYWQGLVPGTTSANLWTECHDYDELPRLLDPPGGWLQNANDPPWTATVPSLLDPADFPPYLAPAPRLGFRPQRSVRMLTEDESITFEELAAYKHSTRRELADRVLDDLLRAVEAHGGEAVRPAADGAGGLGPARGCGQPRRGALRRMVLPDGRTAIPDALAGRRPPGHALRAGRSQRARWRPWRWPPEQVIEAHDSLDVAWGEVHRLRLGDRDLPASGGPGFRSIWFSRGPDGRSWARGGDSFVAVVEFGDPVRARSLLGYGNASQPGSPHRGDQLELMARQELRPVWRTRAEVEANLARREVMDLY